MHNLQLCDMRCLIKGIKSPISYIKLYRICMAYCISHHYTNGQSTLDRLGIDINDQEYRQCLDALMIQYDHIKGTDYNGYKMAQWCTALGDDKLDLYQPNSNHLKQYPSNALNAFIAHLNDGQVIDSHLSVNRLKEVLGDDPLLKFEKMLVVNEFNQSTIEAVYCLWLLNAYAYYYNDKMLNDLQEYRTSDHQWDWISRELGKIKNRLNPDVYPILFDQRYEPGLS